MELSTDEEMGTVSIVGAGMRSHPGVAAKVFNTLGDHGINIEIITTSPIKITCAIRTERVPEAVRAPATGDEGEAMAVRHRERPVDGVQFHPESVLTPIGPDLARNFLAGP